MDQQPSTALAQCCYASLMTDTGGFRYGKTSTTTFQIASFLVAHGAHPWQINSSIYENEPVGRLKLLSQVLSTLELSGCGRLAFIQVNAKMYARTGTDATMLDGFINYARSIQGVEVATQLRELGGDRFKISFRSSGSVNVAQLAEAFGGGGHHNAAGCVIEGDPSLIQAQLSDRLSCLLDSAQDTPN